MFLVALSRPVFAVVVGRVADDHMIVVGIVSKLSDTGRRADCQ